MQQCSHAVSIYRSISIVWMMTIAHLCIVIIMPWQLATFFLQTISKVATQNFTGKFMHPFLIYVFFLYVFFGTFSQHLLPQFVQFKMPIAAPRSGDPENPQLPTLQFPRLYGPIPALDQLQCTWTADLKVTIRASFLFLPGVESVGRRKTDGKGWERMVNDGQWWLMTND